MKIIMLGAPGAGKGTQAKQIAQAYNIPHISTGDIFRANIKEGTELGKKAQEYMDKGLLVPDELVCDLVVDRIHKDDCEKGYILDGFPRTIKQAEELDKILEKENKKVDMVINLTTPKEEIIERIVNRRVCSNQECKTVYNIVLNPPKVEGICDKCGSKLLQRKDDNVETVESRIDTYLKNTSPLVEYYTKQNKISTQLVSKTVNKLGANVAKDILEQIK